MKDLKIKIGDIITRASEVVFIKVPLYRITQHVFSKVSSAKEKTIEQLIIRQIPPPIDYVDYQERFEVPEEIKDLNELKVLSITGNVSSLPSWIGDLSTLCLLTVSYSYLLTSLPESIGNLSNLTSLDLSSCSKLKCFPSPMQNLKQLTNVKLTNCTFKSIPSGIEYLKEVIHLNLSGCENLESLPESLPSPTPSLLPPPPSSPLSSQSTVWELYLSQVGMEEILQELR